MISKQRWTDKDIGDQSGRVAIVTGANSGIGYETARMLALKGARVVLACRSEQRGQAALDRIVAEQPAGSAELALLDLSSLDSVRNFVGSFVAANRQLDLLINNAGVMIPPESKTTDGFELQFGVNHLGHFALTAGLLPLLNSTEGSRVVNVSSMAHRFGHMDFDDLNFEQRGYSAMGAYGQSKLANLLFTAELQRRLEAAGADTLVVAAHPGWTATDLQRGAWYMRMFNPLFAMRPPQGALPTLAAALDAQAQGNDYYGPSGFQELRGLPRKVGRSEAAQSVMDAQKLWQVSEELTGARFELMAEAV